MPSPWFEKIVLPMMELLSPLTVKPFPPLYAT